MKLTFLQRLKFVIFGLPDVSWVDRMPYIESSLGEQPTGVTVREAYAILANAMENGSGDSSLVIELTHKDGQLCGHQHSRIAEIRIVMLWGIGNYSPTITFVPAISLIHLGKSAFKNTMAYECARGSTAHAGIGDKSGQSIDRDPAQPIVAPTTFGPTKAWKQQAYPLQSIRIDLQGTRHSDQAALLAYLDQIKQRILDGDLCGEESDDDFGYKFLVASTETSIFDAAATAN